MGKFLKRNANTLFVLLFEMVVGLLIIIDPIKFTSVIIIVIGAMVAVAGISNIVTYFKTDPFASYFDHTMAIGIVELALGLVAIFKSSWFVSLLSVFTVFYGVVSLAMGVIKIQIMVDAIRMKNNKWFMPLISAVVSIAFAVVIFLNPFDTTEVLLRFIGIYLVADSVFDVTVMAVLNQHYDDVLDTVKDIIEK